MAIRTTKKSDKGNRIEYKSSKFILTPQDIQKADTFDLKLTETIKKIENYLVEKGALSRNRKKNDPLFVWYTVGKKIDTFIKKNKIEKEEEKLFWNQFYSRSTLIHKKESHKICPTRNDFRTALLLAQFPFKNIVKVGRWSLWRDILIYKVLLNDKRLLKWVIDYLIENPKTVHGARPFLKAITGRFKKMETTILSDKELLKKIKEIRIKEIN